MLTERLFGAWMQAPKAPAPAAASKPVGGSLYEKLLAKEIREDRSRLLQALRFFVTRGFFSGTAAQQRE